MRTYKTPDGEFPSVTTVLSIIDKPFLRTWYASEQFKADKDLAWKAYEGIQTFEDRTHFDEFMKAAEGAAKKKGEEAMARGSWVHGAIEFWLKEGFNGK